MCGLAGCYAGGDRRVSEELLLTMTGELRHRGPDGVGVYSDERFGMASTRLAIIDLVGGDQPISNENGRYWVMQNGEIYNHVELHADLVNRGHVFQTQCDTEVIVHAYEEWGEECLLRLNGDFAFAIWDRDERELFLARDRFGVRPLYLARFGGDFSFASEAKALLRHPRAERRLDAVGLVETFTLWSVSPERSAFEGISELAPAHFLRVGPNGAGEQRRWWDLEFRPGEAEEDASEMELARELRDLLDDATRLRLRADVPVGAYMSGGLDSSAIAALAARPPRKPPVSFGVAFADERFDESDHQDRMARELALDLSRVRVTARDIADSFPAVVAAAETPTLRTAPAPLYRLSAAVRDANLKVVVTGEGADELFGGYDIFLEAKIRRFWARDPASQARPLLFGRLYPYLAADLARTGAFAGRFFGRGFEQTDDPLYSHRVRFANTARCLHLLDRELVERASAAGDPLARLQDRLPSSFRSFTPLGQAQYLEVTTFLEGYLLHAQGDRMLMAHSIEGRFPFLDYRVAEFAARLPDRVKIRGLREKHLLRKAMAPLLPDEIVNRRKQPYRAPIAAAFTGPDAPEYVGELLRPESLEQAGVFSPHAVEKVVRKFGRGSRAVSETDEIALVGVVSTMLLHEQLVARPQLAQPLRPVRRVVGDRVELPLAPAGAAA